ncbi:MAG: low molecular weight phosphotyrosine protein phosphatase [Clostridiales bacterium]|nr:low molecular weight phosphotyrosine protein phosphatase [Clostridiales bacterium]
MIKILFVCHGNICRSPMGQMIFADMVKKRGVESAFVIDSAATSTEEIGNGIYPPARQMLLSKGVPLIEHRAVQVRKEDYGKFDLFIAMDRWNVSNMKRIFGGDPDNKIHLMMEYAGQLKEVDDPWFSGDFLTTYEDLTLACQKLLDKLMKEHDLG